MNTLSLQEQFAPKSICFGCGPANSKGLRIRSYVASESRAGGDLAQAKTLVCRFQPSDHHQAFPHVVNGGIIGSLLDCHSNWTAAYHLMQSGSLQELPCTVTAEFTVKLLRPTPAGETLEILAWPVSQNGDRVEIQADLRAGGKVCASCRGVFVRVGPGHPAFHRW